MSSSEHSVKSLSAWQRYFTLNVGQVVLLGRTFIGQNETWFLYKMPNGWQSNDIFFYQFSFSRIREQVIDT